jgi:hypothetical protein
MSPKQIWRVLKESFGEWNRDNASRLAAALAYYTIFFNRAPADSGHRDRGSLF